VQLLINIVAMLLVLVALVSLANRFSRCFPSGRSASRCSACSLALAPLVWIMGIRGEATTAAVDGTKTVLNELLAYIDLAKLPRARSAPAAA